MIISVLNQTILYFCRWENIILSLSVCCLFCRIPGTETTQSTLRFNVLRCDCEKAFDTFCVFYSFQLTAINSPTHSCDCQRSCVGLSDILWREGGGNYPLLCIPRKRWIRVVGNIELRTWHLVRSDAELIQRCVTPSVTLIRLLTQAPATRLMAQYQTIFHAYFRVVHAIANRMNS